MTQTRETPTLSRAALLFAVLTAALTVALFMQMRTNRRLRVELAAMTEAKARARGLGEGEVLAPIRLLDPAGAEASIRFDESVGTLLLFYASGCDACAATREHWIAALAEAKRPDVRVLTVQTDGAHAPAHLAELPPSFAVPLPPRGWLADLPAVPATLVIDSQGRLARAWYGELDDSTRGALVTLLTTLGS